MDKKAQPEVDDADAPREPTSEKSTGFLSRLKLRHIVYGSLVSSGAMTLGAWNAQAHGNRSSHMTANILWGVNSYVINRQLLLAPNAASTLKLNSLVQSMSSLQASSASVAAFSKSAAVPEAASSAAEKERAKISKELKKLAAEREELESKLALTPITKRVFGLLSQGREREAINAIEGEGDRQAILSAYIWAQLDLYNAGFVDGRSTTKYINELATISTAAIRYYDSLPGKSKDIKRAGAALMHNFASFSLPDVGSPSARILADGRSAAERALRLRIELGDPEGIVNARLMVGIEAFHAAEFRDAEHDFRAALKLAQEVGNGDGAAWSSVQLARALTAGGGAKGKKEAQALLAAARQYFAADDESLAMIDQLLSSDSG